MASRGTRKSAVSRRFVAKTAAQLATWRSTALDALDLVALLIDGVHIGEHCIVMALGNRSHRSKTGARPLGWVDGECDRASEPLGGSPEPRPADRSQPDRRVQERGKG